VDASAVEALEVGARALGVTLEPARCSSSSKLLDELAL
jgi:hypothetical protein